MRGPDEIVAAIVAQNVAVRRPQASSGPTDSSTRWRSQLLIGIVHVRDDFAIQQRTLFNRSRSSFSFSFSRSGENENDYENENEPDPGSFGCDRRGG